MRVVASPGSGRGSWDTVTHMLPSLQAGGPTDTVWALSSMCVRVQGPGGGRGTSQGIS